MDRKKKKRLGIMALTVAFLGLGYAAEDRLLVKMVQKQAQREAEAQSDAAILSLPAQSLTQIRFAGTDREIVFERSGGRWNVPGDESFPLNEAAVEKLAADLENLAVTRAIGTGADPAEYGLSPARQTVTAVSGEEKTELYIGDRNESTRGLYIASSKVPDEIFLTSQRLDEDFRGSLKDFALYEDVPSMPADQIRCVRVDKGKDSFMLDTPGDDTCTVTDADGKQESADLGITGTVLSQLENLNWLKHYEYNAESAQILEGYGLDKPRAVITVTMAPGRDENEDHTVVLQVGDRDGNGNYYVQTGGSRQVHSIREEYLSALVEGKAMDFWRLSYSFVSVSDLDLLDVTAKGKTHRLQRISENGMQDDAHVIWMADGRKADKDLFNSFYYACVSVTAQERISPVPDYGNTDPVLTLDYHLTDGSRKIMRYYEEDRNFFTVVYENDTRAARVNRLYVQAMLDALDALTAEEQEQPETLLTAEEQELPETSLPSVP